MAELKPCPFCGGEAFVKDVVNILSYKMYYAQCSECDAKSKKMTSVYEVTKRWNTRFKE